MEHELLVYIHGVSPLGQKSHAADYSALHTGISSVRSGYPEKYCSVEWGWHDGTPNPKSHQLLSDAEQHLGARALRAVDDPRDFTLNLLRIAVGKFRSLLIYNFSDMFYYTSEDGKNAIRYVVAKSIVDGVRSALTAKKDSLLSLTLLAHSAGSVAAFDFLFFLFGPRKEATAFINPAKVKATPSDAVYPMEPAQVEKTLDELQELRRMADADRLRVRRLFTFGSPITPLAFRCDAILEILSRSANSRLESAQYGLTRNPEAFGKPLENPRWVNIWDKDDPIGWPVEPLMSRQGEVVKDAYVDVSDSMISAHSAYWRSSRVQAVIAKAW
jgi:hypothetical protein